MELPNYASQLLLQLNQQRSKGFLCDVIIMVENTLFRAHKSVLAATSHYFKSLVLHDNLIHLDPDMVDTTIFQQILDFIYTGKLSDETLDDLDLSSLLTTANYLQLTDLANLCSSKINQNGSFKSLSRGSSLRVQRFSSPTSNNSSGHSYDRAIEDHSSDTETYCMTPPKKRHNAQSRCISRKKQDLGLDLSKKNSNSETLENDEVLVSRTVSNNMQLGINVKCIPKEEKWIIPLDGAQERKREGSRRKSKVNGYIPPNRAGSQLSQNQTFTLELSVKKEIGEKMQDETEGQKPNNGSTNFVYQKETFLKEAEGDNPYVCIPCEKGFPSSESLKSHVQTHINEDVDVKVEDEEEGEGDLGGTRVSQEAPESLEQSPPKSLKDVDTLRPFPCNICGKMFTQRGTMTRHMRSHLGLKPFACEECGMRFTRQYRLTEHMRVHSGEKPYKCQVCGGKFTQQRNLISHMRMHTS
ncbi:hypermethylated in cancer 2 protein-like [Myxocyprinus asiaticus]|uniref:hypermethylated in cancer 2 protein-like n=1 Tax=Myxocyprinus asiaticus TaxID=70543 RepID=UPI00222305CF|nr:hypermethylated in cancer 2 protein-like [Myxocyprinus asiaticus]